MHKKRRNKDSDSGSVRDKLDVLIHQNVTLIKALTKNQQPKDEEEDGTVELRS